MIKVRHLDKSSEAVVRILYIQKIKKSSELSLQMCLSEQVEYNIDAHV